MKKINTIHTPQVKFSYDTIIVNKATKARIYKNATLLTPGVFSDSITMAPVIYREDILKKFADKWESNYLNIDHSYKVLDRIGYIVNPHFANHKIVADLYIYPITRNARDVIALIDNNLINWMSVEIKTEDDWDMKENKRYVKEMEFIGAAVVTSPACSDAIIKEDGPKFNAIE